MLSEHSWHKLYWIAVIIAWGIASSVLGQETDSPQDHLLTGQMLLERAYQEGSVPVIIKLRLPAYAPEGALPSTAAVAGQRADISQTQTRMLAQLSAYDIKQVKQYKYLPLLAMRLDAVGLRATLADSKVEAVYEDRLVRPSLAESTPLIGATTAWQQGFAGNGQVVAILDTGVDKNHPFLTGKVVDEACFSTTNTQYGVQTVCPNGQSRQTGAGAGAPCQADDCEHGTHVAGIAAGRGAAFSGVARDAKIIAVQVFSATDDSVSAFFSDIALGLEHVYEQRGRFNIAAVNMSLGGGRYTGYCDSSTPLKPFIDLLRSVGIATVIASGNESYKDSVSAPACISSAISVGATSKQDSVANFSNSAPILNLLAPGVSINSSVPDGGFEHLNGTSMATPHVVGAFAVLRSKAPTASVDTLLNALRNTGVTVTDAANGLRKPRIQVDAALNALDSGGAGSLRVTPATGLSASGPASGPFSPTSQTYQLTNSGSTAINFEVSESVEWASVSLASGSLDPGASASVVIAITAGANTLPAGDYASAVNFTNTTNNVGSTSRTLALSITAPASSNDKFENAILLNGGSGSTTGSNDGASKESGEPNHAGLTGGRSVWWRWVAPLTGEVTFDTFGSSFDTLLGAYTGSNIAALTPIAGNDDDGGGRQSRIRFRTSANTTYYIAVDGYNGVTGNIVLNWQFTPDALPPGGIAVSPQDNYAATGPQGGPFNPASIAYTLTNVSTAAASFTVQEVPAWLTASTTSGTLPPGGSTQVTLSINAAVASTLQPGQYTGAVLFNTLARAVTLQVSSIENIPNDNFSSATVLNGTAAQVTASNVGAGKESGEPEHAGNSGGHSVWWKWTAPAAGVATIDTFGSNFDTLLGVYTGSQVTALTQVASNDDTSGVQSRVSFPARAGETYYIAVDGWGGRSGSIVLNLALTPAASQLNDDFANAALLEGTSVTVNASNQNASKETDEPNHAGNSGGHSVWWKWTAPAAGAVAIDTFGSSFDTLLGVYTGSPVTALTLVASNDDTAGRQSRVAFQAVAGRTYTIAVDGWNGNTGSIVLHLTLTPISGQSNDDFANAALLQGAKTTVTASNQNASKEADEPNHAGKSGGHSVWWKWTAPAAGTATLDTFGSSFDTLLGVYTGSPVTALTLVASNDDTDGRQSRVTFQAVAGRTYTIAVDGYNGAMGSITLNLDLTVVAIQPNDDFAAAALLEGTSATVNASNQNASKETGEPDHAGSRGGHSVWWKWTAPVAGIATIDTFGSSFDTLLGIYTGTEVADLTPIASDDDTGGMQSLVAFRVTAGTVYYLAVDGYGGNTGSIVLHLALQSSYLLTVTRNGVGSVVSSPPGIDCGDDCTEDYASGTSVTLTAVPTGGSSFIGWSGACSGTGGCQVTMDQAQAVTAAFTLPNYTLTVAKTGPGTVSSSPPGINCGSDCQQDYPSGTMVILTATPASGSVFAGWSGACSGTGACQVSMTQDAVSHRHLHRADLYPDGQKNRQRQRHRQQQS